MRDVGKVKGAGCRDEAERFSVFFYKSRFLLFLTYSRVYSRVYFLDILLSFMVFLKSEGH